LQAIIDQLTTDRQTADQLEEPKTGENYVNYGSFSMLIISNEAVSLKPLNREFSKNQDRIRRQPAYLIQNVRRMILFFAFCCPYSQE